MKELFGYNIIMYLTEWAKLALVCFGILGMKFAGKKRIAVGFFSIMLISLIGTGCFNWHGNFYNFFNGCLVIVAIGIGLMHIKKIGFVVLVYMCICFLDDMIATIIMLFTSLSLEQLEQQLIVPFLMDMVSVIIFLICTLLKRKFFDEFEIQKIAWYYIILLMIGYFSLSAYIESIIAFADQQGYQKHMSRIIVLVVVSSVVFMLTVILLIFNLYKKQKIEYQFVINERLRKMQEAYYVNLLQKNEETKKFRHDIKEHLYCMQLLLRDKNYIELDEYFNNINENFKEIATGIQTGNRLVDIIVNDLQQRHENVSIMWAGSVSNDLDMSSFSICTVFYNILNNAMEAAEQAEKKKVKVTIKKMEKNILVYVENTYKGKPNVVCEEFISTKKSDGHGYGIKNVQMCINKIGGVYRNRYGNGIFITEIVLPIKV